MNKLSLIARAGRLSFLSVSLLPYIWGSLLPAGSFQPAVFWIGLITVAGFHLGANLANDYADSRSGSDWQDTRFYGFFGGSKLIQEGVLSEKVFFYAAWICFAVALTGTFILAAVIGNKTVLILFLPVLLFSWGYAGGVLRLAYRRMGELTVFIIFGPLLINGAWLLQTGELFGERLILLSFIPGLLAVSILLANEVPDSRTDQASGKFNLVGLSGTRHGYLLYAFCFGLALILLAAALKMNWVGWLSLAGFAASVPAARATRILRREYENKHKLIAASRSAVQAAVTVMAVLAADAVINRLF